MIKHTIPMRSQILMQSNLNLIAEGKVFKVKYTQTQSQITSSNFQLVVSIKNKAKIKMVLILTFIQLTKPFSHKFLKKDLIHESPNLIQT
jgi:hypothetical protein